MYFNRPSTYPDIGWIGHASADIVHNFVCSEESHGIWIALERLHNSKYPGEVGGGVGTAWIGAIDALLRGVDVDNHVYAGSIEYAGAQIVVRSWIDIVNSNSIDLARS
jgi:hypothetical protein